MLKTLWISYQDIRQFLIQLSWFPTKTFDGFLLTLETFEVSFQDIRQFLVHASDSDVAPSDGTGRGEELELGDDADDSNDERYARALQRLVHWTPQLPDRASVSILGSRLMIHSSGGYMISQRGRQLKREC